MAASNLEQDYFTHDFNTFISQQMEQWKIPGLSIAVIQDNDIVTKGYGVTRPNGPPVTPDTPFDCASMAKSFTAASAALLVDDNERHPDVKWTTPVSRLLPDDFRLHDPYLTQNVTLIDMLSHRIGIPRNDDATLGRNAASPDTPRTVCRKLRHLPATKPFRTHFLYNNLIYTSVAHLVEVLAEQPLPQFLHDRFFKPLGMDRTFVAGHRPDYIHESELAQGSWWDEQNKQYVPVIPVWGAEGLGAGEIQSSTVDWAKWVRSQIQRSNGVSEDSLTELFEPRILADTELAPDDPHQSYPFYAMGWQVEYYNGQKVLSHGGNITGFSSFMGFLPKKKFGFVMYANSAGLTHAHEIIAYRLIDHCLKIPHAQRADWNQFVVDRAARDKVEAKSEEDKLFPDRPTKPLPMTLPLDAYVGRYEHAAYGVLEVSVRDGNLFVDASDRTYRLQIHFEHVSLNFFIAHLYELPMSIDDARTVKAEFRVNVAGVVDELGIDFVGDDGGEVVWLKRVT